MEVGTGLRGGSGGGLGACGLEGSYVGDGLVYDAYFDLGC